MQFWEHVKAEILRQDTTQEWVAGKSGIPIGTFRSSISRGNIPPVGRAVKIAQALGVSVEFLVTGHEAKARPCPEKCRPICEDLRVLPDAELSSVAIMIHGLAERYRHKAREAGAG